MTAVAGSGLAVAHWMRIAAGYREDRAPPVNKGLSHRSKRQKIIPATGNWRRILMKFDPCIAKAELEIAVAAERAWAMVAAENA
jgi:hypothetical protein